MDRLNKKLTRKSNIKNIDPGILLESLNSNNYVTHNEFIELNEKTLNTSDNYGLYRKSNNNIKIEYISDIPLGSTNIIDIAYFNNRYVFGFDNGHITSTNLINWTTNTYGSQIMSDFQEFRIYNNMLMSPPLGSNVPRTTNGINWQFSTSTGLNVGIGTSIAFKSGSGYITSYSNNNTDLIWRSTNLINWTAFTMGLSNVHTFIDQSNNFIMFKRSSTMYALSTNSINWTVSSTQTFPLFSQASGNTFFVNNIPALIHDKQNVSQRNKVLVFSTNLTNWTVVNDNNNEDNIFFAQIKYDGLNYYAISENQDSSIYMSKNLKKWKRIDNRTISNKRVFFTNNTVFYTERFNNKTKLYKIISRPEDTSFLVKDFNLNANGKIKEITKKI